MIRPWYRSVLFWLGIPGLLFLLWAWRSSNLTGHQLTLGSWELTSTQGKALAWSMRSDLQYDFWLDYRTAEVFTEWIAPNSPPRAGRIVPLVAAYPIPPGQQCWFPAARWQAKEINRDARYRLVSLPYWLLAGIYVGLWLGGVVWNQLRKSRLLKHHAPPPP